MKFTVPFMGVIPVLAVLGTLSGCDGGEARIEWECNGTTKNSMQCHFKNEGTVAGEACFDIVQVCSSGEHVANVCTGVINPGEMENKVVTHFAPGVGIFERCMGIEYRNKRINYPQS